MSYTEIVISDLQSRYTPMVKSLSSVLAAAIAGGNILIALAPMLGLVQKGAV